MDHGARLIPGTRVSPAVRVAPLVGWQRRPAGLNRVVRATDRLMFDKFGYTTCCGPRTRDMQL